MSWDSTDTQPVSHILSLTRLHLRGYRAVLICRVIAHCKLFYQFIFFKKHSRHAILIHQMTCLEICLAWMYFPALFLLTEISLLQ